MLACPTRPGILLAIGALSVLFGGSALADDAQSLLAAARSAQARLDRNPARLKLRHNSENVIRRWHRAAEQAEGPARIEALKGELKAWKRLAHWSGGSKDRASVKRVEKRLAESQARAKAPRRAKKRSRTDAKSDALAKARAHWLPSVTIEVEGARFVAVLPIKHRVTVKKHVIPARPGRGPRVYFDVTPLVASLQVLGVKQIDHAAVSRLRVGQYDADTVRIVLDVGQGLTLPDPIGFQHGKPARIVVGRSEPDRADPLAVLGDLERTMKAAVAGDIDEDSPSESRLSPREAMVLRAIVQEVRDSVTEDAPPSKPEARAAAPTAAKPAVTKPSPEAIASKSPAAKAKLSKAAVPKAASSKAASKGSKTAAPTKLPLPSGLRKSTLRALAPRGSGLLRIRRIVIDPGHGGKDTGAIGARKRREKDVNLAIAKKLGRALTKQLGVKVIYTRTTDRFISLQRRAQIANRAKADLFISVHANASRNKRVHGIETYYLNTTTSRYSSRLAARENAERFRFDSLDAVEPKVGTAAEPDGAVPPGPMSRSLELLLADLAMKSVSDESRRLAGLIQTASIGSLRRNYPDVRDLGVKKALFYVLLGVRMPAVLVEAGFMSHGKESARLTNARYQDRLAASIARGVVRFVQERRQLASKL